MGLQGGRAGQLPAELQHGVHRRVRAAGARVRPEDGQRGAGGEQVPADGRRHQGAAPGRLGMGRRRHGRRRQAGGAGARLTARPSRLPPDIPPPVPRPCRVRRHRRRIHIMKQHYHSLRYHIIVIL